MVPPSSIRISRVPTYSSWLTSLVFQIRDFHPLRFGFPTNSSIRQLDVSLWAVPLSLAATHRISFDFFSSGYWDVSLPQVRFIHLCIQWMISKEQMTKDFLDNNFIWSYEARFHYCLLSSVLCLPSSGRVPPFGYLRINACLSTPRSFSQTTTSFFASYCQGIHRVRLITWSHNPKWFFDLLFASFFFGSRRSLYKIHRIQYAKFYSLRR